MGWIKTRSEQGRKGKFFIFIFQTFLFFTISNLEKHAAGSWSKVTGTVPTTY